MMSKDLLKQIGIISVSFGLVASPLTFAQNATQDSVTSDQPPAAQSTDSAADPMDKMDKSGAGQNKDGMSSHEYESDMDEQSPAAESTDSASNPMQKEGSTQAGQSLSDDEKDMASDSYEPDADKETPAEEATDD